MVIVRIQKVIWSEYTKRHVEKHDVSISEAEQVIYSDSYVLEGHSGKKILVNKVGTRIIAVIVKMTGNKLYVATARDVDKKERVGLYEYQKINTSS